MKHWKLALVILLALIAALALGAACAETAEFTYSPDGDLLLAERDVETSADIESLFGTWTFYGMEENGTTYDETYLLEKGYKPEDMKFVFGPGYMAFSGQLYVALGYADNAANYGEWRLSSDGKRLSFHPEGSEKLTWIEQQAVVWFFDVHGDDNDLISIDSDGGTLTLKRAAPYDPSLDALYAQGNDAEAPAEAVEAEAPEQTDGPGEVHKDKATVKAAQQALNEAGYNCGTPDGVAGKKTKSAISNYQTDKGLTVTGTVTDELLASLGLN